LAAQAQISDPGYISGAQSPQIPGERKSPCSYNPRVGCRSGASRVVIGARANYNPAPH